MIEIRTSTAKDIPRMLDIWREAVDATHDFLTPEDRATIEEEVASLLPQMRFHLAVNQRDQPLGFMLLEDGHLEALFIHPDEHGKGIGKTLIRRALAQHPQLTLDVNEQNPKAWGFYTHLGFEAVGRSERDGQGSPYPLIHLRYSSDS